MKKKEIEVIVMTVLRDFCGSNNISADIDSHTSLFGENKILDSMGLINVIVDIETAFLEKNIEISFTGNVRSYKSFSYSRYDVPFYCKTAWKSRQ